jgi:hypothetical protein
MQLCWVELCLAILSGLPQAHRALEGEVHGVGPFVLCLKFDQIANLFERMEKFRQLVLS